MSDWLISKSPKQAADVFKKAAKIVNIMANNNLFIVEGANPANWYVQETSEWPLFVMPHFILTKPQNEVYMKDLIYLVSVSNKHNCLSFRNQKNVLA
jgi:hypothetical protein